MSLFVPHHLQLMGNEEGHACLSLALEPFLKPPIGAQRKGMFLIPQCLQLLGKMDWVGNTQEVLGGGANMAWGPHVETADLLKYMAHG